MGHQRAAVTFLTATGVFTVLLGVFRGPFVTPLLMVLQATSLPCFFPTAIALISRVFPGRLTSLGVSLIGLLAILFGVGAIPPAIGYLAEGVSFSLGFSVLGILVLMMVPVVFKLRTDIALKEERF
jgi:MFS family permease